MTGRPRVEDLPSLDAAERRRYARHLTLPEVGIEGQSRLKAASIVVVGAGGLGAPLVQYLAAAGVGRLGIVDFDRVDESNLQRQVLYGTSDVGRPKTEVAAERVAAINPHVEVVAHPVRLEAANARAIVTDYDLVVDGTDNFATRYLVNDACVLTGTPNVYGSIYRFEGQVAVFDPPEGPCYRCLFPEPPPPGEVPNCAEGGVLGVLPGIVGCLQASEAIKLVLGNGPPLRGRLLLVDALGARFRELRLRRDRECPLCGDAPTIRELADPDVTCGTGAADGAPMDASDVTVVELKARLERGEDLELLDVRTAPEREIATIEGARWIPMQEIPQRLAEIDRGRDVVVFCHLGGRSAQVVRYLAERDYDRVYNLTGGIRAWSREIDPGVPDY